MHVSDPSMATTSDAHGDVEVLTYVETVVRDGTVLVSDVYLPAAEGVVRPGPFPVVLERTPYGRDSDRLVGIGIHAAKRGYAFVVQDVRGRGDSGGRFHLMTNRPDEGMDGADSMAWVLEQSWCDGRIATVGGSFSAANQQAAALHHPGGLRVQVLRDCGTNYYRRMFRTHGAFNVGVVLPWALSHGPVGHEATADPEVKLALEKMRSDIASWVSKMPLRRNESPLALAESYEDAYFTMWETADDGEYWENPTVRLEGRWDEYPTDVAVLMISGWYAHHAAANFDKLNEFGKRLEKPVRLIVGPWIHASEMVETRTAGDVDFGLAATQHGPRFDLWFEWIDRFIGGAPDGARGQASLDYFVMGLGDGHKTPEGLLYHGGEWRTAEEWPLPDVQFQDYFLHHTGLLSEKAPPKNAPPSRYDFDPEDPCPGIGSTNLQMKELPSFVLPGPQDQRCRPSFAACRGSSTPLNDRLDVLSFQTEPLVDPVEVTGPLQVHLCVSSSARDTDFTARLIDVYTSSMDYPEGYAMLVSEGILRMRYRDDRSPGELIEPGREYDVEIELGPTSNLFKAGHRIRLDISSSAFPQYDVNPNTGEPLGFHTRTEIAHQTVFHDEVHGSRLVLPVRAVTDQR